LPAVAEPPNQAAVPATADARAIAAIRGLAMDAPHAARSGHQGTAMSLAPLAHALWSRVMRYDATDPYWPDRDRLILSAGHASILLYSGLFLTGHGLELDDLRAFRQWGSATPGHPEAGHTAGVEVTTGPLGQGFGNAVGMAMAERYLRARFGPGICDHRIWVICSDGDLMEGVSHEAASLAGHLGLGRIVAIYDDNGITIDGRTSLSYSDDVPARFRAYGWEVTVLDAGAAEDLDALTTALEAAAAVQDRPSLVVLRTRVGYPATEHTDHHAAHGYAIVDAEISATKALLGLPDEPFAVADDVLAWYREVGQRGRAARLAWDERLDAVAPSTRAEIDAALFATPLSQAAVALPHWPVGASVATRTASQEALRALAPGLGGLIAGAADLTGNVGLALGDAGSAHTADHPAGNQVFYGIREHGMAAAAVGMARHGGVLPVIGTFFVFADYLRPALRLAALSQAKVIFVFSHDSVGVGEDGPTHQPVEHLASLRAMPGLTVIRPADANETVAAWQAALAQLGPSALILSRQNLPVLEGTAGAGQGVSRGAYVLVEPDEEPDLVLVATGSEVALCVEAARLLDAELAVRVVSMPSWELFAAQDAGYQESVFPLEVPVLSVEAGVTLGWERWADDSIGIDHFGASAPAAELFEHFGLTISAVVDRARALAAEVYEDV
jgi:transketolase